MEDIILNMVFDQETPNKKRKAVGKGKKRQIVVVPTMKYIFKGAEENVFFTLTATGEKGDVRELFAHMNLNIDDEDEDKILVSLSKSE